MWKREEVQEVLRTVTLTQNMLAAARLQGMFCLSKKYIKIHNPTLRNRMQMKRIADIPKSDRPREKMQQKGAEALSDHELLAILLGAAREIVM